ncbi:hypothetical protein [Hoylesella pleuritidis]|jgi:hypothetical protein|uniref:Uncharacterized protein n=1 Tax=Hoylesella pleuritidis F0068 TaxID=1081904 RepID=U2L688_9BACT|nr:hypothetical protein [Hoylesella pleuritidis]ERK00018.1 hypothetical protein HMPREF1218_1615 [Hoylesella pleuritidis F0068]
MMKENQVKKGFYCKPKIKVFNVDTENLLQETSYPGQHKPGHHGESPEEDTDDQNGAKRGFFDNESSFWED